MADTDWRFNRHDRTQGVPRELGAGIDTRIFAGEHVMLSIVHLAPNAEGTIHSHAEEQWGLLLEGSCTRIQADEAIEMRPGDFWRTPPNVSHGIRAGADGAVVVDIFGPPRPEYRRPGRGFGT